MTICVDRSSGRIDASEPLTARPIGLRAVATMTASGMTTSFLHPAGHEKGSVPTVIHHPAVGPDARPERPAGILRPVMTGTLRVAIGAGGTGGHIYPGLAVAKALEELGDVDVCFISTKRGLQTTLVPQAGYELFMFDMLGLQGVKSAVLMAPQLIRSGIQAARLIKRRGVDVVIGMGGYPSTPAMVGAKLAGVPSLIHESNAVPGRANAFIARLTPNIAIAFERSRQHLPKRADVRTVGMPLLPEVGKMDRASLRQPARQLYGLTDGQRLVVVSGGSLGAQSLTTAALDLADQWRGRDDVAPRDQDRRRSARRGRRPGWRATGRPGPSPTSTAWTTPTRRPT